jgi:outer membrane protein assembly factor BamA
MRPAICLLGCLLAWPLLAQTRYTLRLAPVGPDPAAQLAKVATGPHDSLGLHRALRAALAQLHAEGYLLATTYPLQFRPTGGDSSAREVEATAQLLAGPQFGWLSLRPGNLVPALARQVGYREQYFGQRPFRYPAYAKLAQAVLAYYENNGYPFASVRLDSLQLLPSEGGPAGRPQLSASLRVDKGTYIRFDSLMVEGDAKLKPNFLRQLLRLERDQPFSEQRVVEAQRILRALPYLRLARPPELVFRNDRAYLHLWLSHVRASQFDGIVGILPNQERPNQVLVTGQVNIRLQNLFSAGKSLRVEWQRLRTNSQLFNAEYDHPHLLNTRIGANARFGLLREDTSFLNISRGIQLTYPVGRGGVGTGRVSFFARINSTTVTDTTTGPRDQTVIRFADTRFNAYGLGYEFSSIDDPLRPLRGWRLQWEASAGNKLVRPRNITNDSLLGTLRQNSVQIASTATLWRFVRTGRATSLLLRAQGGLLFNENLFLNDLFRFGGLATLRGFNENTFFASRYLIGTVEYRLYFEQVSYLFAFADQGFWGYQVPGQARQDSPLGLGVGMNLGFKGGIFTFAYALGRGTFPQQGFSFSQSKIHFGYVNRF